MDSERLDKLLNRYWNCVSTLEEEEELRKYFSENYDQVPDELKDVASLFVFYKKESSSQTLGKDFDKQVLETLQSKGARGGRIRRLYSNYLKVAAAVLIVITASYFFRQSMAPEKRPELLGTYEDPEQAFEQTKKALELIASKLNKGTRHAEKIKIFNQAEEKIRGEEEKENNDVQL